MGDCMGGVTLVGAHLPSGTLGSDERILAEGRVLFFAVKNWMCGVCACVNR